MNQSRRTPDEVTPLFDESAATRAKHERLALARALVIAQFGPAALVELDPAPSAAALVTSQVAMRA